MLKSNGVLRLLRCGCLNNRVRSSQFILSTNRLFSTSRAYLNSSNNQDASRTRNIGIIAHIDAGKTTTTERMLYYSGHTRRIGDVDEGSTVTDFLPAERARGITIQSAAITFSWPPNSQFDDDQQREIAEKVEQNLLPRSALPHNINLIDTPGHADFTFEVRRSLRILDGAICILDGVAGVEAQTEQVWNQALEWKIPRIAYVNKLDRDGAAFGRTVREIGSRLNGWPAVCQIPWFEGGKGSFTGIADVVSLQGLLYEPGGDGKTIKHYNLEQLDQVEPGLGEDLRRARIALIELLSEHDDILVAEFLEVDGDHLQISASQIRQSLRRSLLQENSPIIPVFAGASFRNIGVQPLLDAVNDLLPNPNERPDAEVSIGSISGDLSDLLKGNLLEKSKQNTVQKHTKNPTALKANAGDLKGCALAFKVVNDPRKGVLVYVRVYSGSIDRNAVLFNTNLQLSERATNLLQMYASESISVQKIEAGQIGVIAGSKYARTGDTLISYQGNKATPPKPLDQLQLRPINIPPPVFFAAIEPNSLREEKDMHEKLALLLREDPSLQVTQDEDTGQTLLSGMGELHLEIARDRLVNDLKANASMGKIDIGYRETLLRPSNSITKTFDKDRSDSKGKAGCTAIAEPIDDNVEESITDDDTKYVWSQDGNIIQIETLTLDNDGRAIGDNTISLPTHLTLQEIRTAYVNGALAALSRGPTYSYPMRNVRVKLIFDPEEHLFGGETSYSALTAAARIATIAAFRDSVSHGGVGLMEPVMNVDISVDDSSLGSVIHDISSNRGGHIISLGDNEAEESDPNEFSRNIDIRRIYAPPDPFESNSQVMGESNQNVDLHRSVKAKVPLKEMVGYLKHLRSMTAGRGTFVMSVDRFEKVTGQREKSLISELRGN